MSIPNYITLFRILLVPIFFNYLVSISSVQSFNRWIAFGIFLFASLTDALDGFWARITHKRTRLGQFLDPLADKLLLLSGYIGLLFVEYLPYLPPLWVTVTIVFRDIVIIIGLVVVFIMTGRVQVKPNILGKFTTAFQMMTILAILLGFKIAIFLWYMTAGLTIISCLSYMHRELKELKLIT